MLWVAKLELPFVDLLCFVSEMTVLSKDISEERKKLFEVRPILQAEDIADGVVYVLSTPEHVQVLELTIKPVGEPH
ncbi:uncharacterized protein LOC135142235 isoform X3 [Zophobas morio]|uniref:uncharacterized protein LOC135142235 isoform X3 n=1 Tax=Zophobas morio TaxID=2755281 RepID=UPI00308298D8